MLSLKFSRVDLDCEPLCPPAYLLRPLGVKHFVPSRFVVSGFECCQKFCEAAEPPNPHVEGHVTQSRVPYINNLTWKSETQPMPPILDPRMLFERLFGAG